MPKTEFIVRFDNVELTKAQASALQSDINKVVASHLSKIGGRQGGVWGSKLGLHPEWYGKWLRMFADLSALGKSKTFRPEKSIR